MKTYHLKVKEIIREIEDAITIRFEPGSEYISYKSGQFLTIILQIDGKEERRSYSICSSPFTDSDIAISVKAIPGGLVSNYLTQKVEPGHTLHVIEPMGHFLLEPQNEARHVILFGAGSGITPLFSILKTVLTKEPSSKVTLIYGNRTRESIMYKKALDDMEISSQGRLNVIHVLTKPDATWVGVAGRIHQATAVNLVEQVAAMSYKKADFFLCGPAGMIDEVVKALDLLAVPKEKIHRENFHAAEALVAPVIATSTNGKSRVTVKDGSKLYKFEVDPANTILETALKLGYNLPYSCQSGMCTACMGKCTAGKVHMVNPDGLTEGEIKQGYVLTCIGHPAAEEVFIEL